MAKYKIYLKKPDFHFIEVEICEKNGNFYLKDNITVKEEHFLFNFLETEENLLKAIIARLDKYGIKKIEKIIN